MPRKHFRKYLPSRDSLMGNRYFAYFGAALGHHNLWHLHRRSVASGVAIGLFCGLIPGPVQMLSAAVFAIVFRANLAVAMFTTLYTNPFTIVPIYLVAYEIGARITGSNDAMPRPHLNLVDKPIAEWLPAFFQWLEALGQPLLVGVPLLALLLASAGYLAVRGAWRLHVIYSWRRRRKQRAR